MRNSFSAATPQNPFSQHEHIASFMQSLSCLLLICASVCAGGTASPRSVLVTGATGRTGSLIYKQLQGSAGVSVRALVRHRDDARTKLGCTACDESEVRGGAGRWVRQHRPDGLLLAGRPSEGCRGKRRASCTASYSGTNSRRSNEGRPMMSLCL